MFGSLGSLFSSSNSKKRRRSSPDWDYVRHEYDDTRNLDEINSEWEEEYGSDLDDDGRGYGESSYMRCQKVLIRVRRWEELISRYGV